NCVDCRRRKSDFVWAVIASPKSNAVFEPPAAPPKNNSSASLRYPTVCGPGRLVHRSGRFINGAVAAFNSGGMVNDDSGPLCKSCSNVSNKVSKPLLIARCFATVGRRDGIVAEQPQMAAELFQRRVLIPQLEFNYLARPVRV